MRAFSFSLARVLAWRRTQMEQAEARLRDIAASIQQFDLARRRLDLSRDRAEQAVRQAPVMEAADLWALAAYRSRLLAGSRALAERKRAAEQQWEAQRQKVMETQRQYRLLEKLEQRRRAEWHAAADREAESLAAESFLAAWNRSEH
jgi:flagellar export protein FliJ